jgi:hypothetical protein
MKNSFILLQIFWPVTTSRWTRSRTGPWWTRQAWTVWWKEDHSWSKEWRTRRCSSMDARNGWEWPVVDTGRSAWEICLGVRKVMSATFPAWNPTASAHLHTICNHCAYPSWPQPNIKGNTSVQNHIMNTCGADYQIMRAKIQLAFSLQNVHGICYWINYQYLF